MKGGIVDESKIPCTCHVIGSDGFYVWKTLDNLRERRSDGVLTNDNGVDIVNGLRVWDYDLEPGTVVIDANEQSHPDYDFHKYWDGWFHVYTDDGRRKLMNGSRLWVRHPHTGELPPARQPALV